MATIKPNSYVLNVDIKQRMSNKTPRFVQFDEAQIVFKIYDGGKPFDLSGFTSAVVTHKTRSNQVISGYGTFEDLNGQRVVVYDYMGSEMKELGNVETSLSIYNDENDKVSVMPFNVQIVRDLSHEYSEKDTSVLQDLIAKTTDAISKIEYAEDQGDYAKEQGTFAETQGNHAKTQGDYAQTQGTRAETLGNKAETQVGQAQDILDVAVPAYERVEEVYSNTVNLENQHAYDATKQYYKNNIVEFNGSSYQALQDTKGNQPPVNASNEYWSLLARKGADGTGTVVRHREEFISTEGQTTFTLKNTYDQFQNRIDVTVGNVPQFSPDNFTEATNTSIKLNEPLPAGIQVVVTYFSEAQPLKNDIQTVVNNHTTNLSAINQEIEDIKVIRHREEFVTTEGQDTFTLKNEYDMNQNRVDVVAGGVPQYSPEHFIEFTNKSIKFTEPFPAGELVIVTYFGKATPLLYDVDTVLDNHSVRLNTSEAELTSISQQLADTVDSTSFIRKPQSPMPDKKGAKTNSPKIIVKNGTDNFSIIQKKNKEYILYNLNKSMGDTGASSVGGSWDLVRLKKAKSVAMAYVAKTTFTHTGTLTTLYAPAQENTAETVLFPLINTIPTEHISSRGDGTGIGMYGISSTNTPTEAMFKLTIGKTRRANVLLFGTANHTSTADIIVNGDIVKTFKPSAISTGSNNYRIVDFDIPTRYLGTTVDVVLRNNDTTGQKLYFGGVNFYELEKYEGQDIDLYKAFVKDETFIDTNGASDYAIFDNDLQKWCGSYHGGETRIAAKMNWINDYSKKFDVEARFTTTDMADANITDGAWIIAKDFKMYQVTNINNKAKMVSEFDFNTDGTIDMTFGLYDNTINSRTLFTALTSTHKDFDFVYFPRYEQLVSGTVGKVFFDLSEGYLKQVNSAKKIEIDQRFTKFHDEYNPEGTYVYNDSNLYRKFYYGIAVNYDGGVNIPSLTFSKSMDFIKQ